MLQIENKKIFYFSCHTGNNTDCVTAESEHVVSFFKNIHAMLRSSRYIAAYSCKCSRKLDRWKCSPERQETAPCEGIHRWIPVPLLPMLRQFQCRSRDVKNLPPFIAPFLPFESSRPHSHFPSTGCSWIWSGLSTCFKLWPSPSALLSCLLPQTLRHTAPITRRRLAAVMAVLAKHSFKSSNFLFKHVNSFKQRFNKHNNGVLALPIHRSNFVMGHLSSHENKILLGTSSCLVSFVKILCSEFTSPQRIELIGRWVVTSLVRIIHK